MRRIETQNGLFFGGDPATNTKGTVVTDDWLNAIQEELAAVVEGLGGTLDPNDSGQLFDWLLASFAMKSGSATQLFRAALAAQFDSSSYVATTAFVKRMGLQFSNVLLITGATVLTAADAGKLIWLAGAGGYNITLPVLSTMITGATFEFFSSSGVACPVIRAGTDELFLNGAGGSTVSIGNGDTLRVTANTGTGWAANGGSAQIGKSAAFGSSLAANGYQKLPSGLIVQWGGTGNITAGSAQAVTYPIAFPSGMQGCSVSPSYATTGAGAAYMSHVNTSASTLTINNTGAVTCAARWLAFGY